MHKERVISVNLATKSSFDYKRTPLNYPDPPSVFQSWGPGGTSSVYKLIRSQPKFLRWLNHLPYDMALVNVKSICGTRAERTFTQSYTYLGQRIRTRESYDFYCERLILPDVRLPDDTYEGMLINRCYAKIKDMKVDVSVTAAEIGQTLELVAGVAKRISDGVTQIVKKDFGKAARTLNMRKPKGASRSKNASDNLLAYQFGVLQLVQDAVGSLQALQDMIQHVPLFSVSARYEEPLVLNNTWVTTWPAVPGFSATYSNRFDGLRKWGISLTFGFDNAFLRNMSQLGLSNPVNSVWQTRPMSWLAGWFVSVDSIMASFDALHGLEFISGSYSKVVRGNVKTRLTSISYPYTAAMIPSLTVAGVQSGVGDTEMAQMRRIVYDVMPPPEFLFRNPFTKGPAGKMATIAAVFRQNIGKSR